MIPATPRYIALTCALFTTLGGCNGSSSGNGRPTGSQPSDATAIVATAAADFSSGEVELIDLGADTLAASGGYHATISDIGISIHGNDYYLMERFQSDRIGKVSLDNPAQFVWRYAAVSEGDSGSANPYSLVFASDDKAYLLRYDSDEVWVVNPQAAREEDFRIGTLDLSAYNPEGTGAPRMSSAIIVDGRLYIAMQRLDAEWLPTQTAYVAVFEVATDTEIDTGHGSNGLKGIPLVSRNPESLIWQAGTGIFIQSVGQFFPQEPTGGIELLDTDTLNTRLLLDDTDTTGLISDFAISDGQGFFIGYHGWGDTALYGLDINTAEVTGPLAELAGLDLRDITTAPDNRLWVADANPAAPGIHILDADTLEKAHFIPTTLLPVQIEFSQ